MVEENINCEESCAFFQALSPEDQEINRRARKVIREGREFPGSLNTMCGSCVLMDINTSHIDRQIDTSTGNLRKK